jgi:hypothetical protein
MPSGASRAPGLYVDGSEVSACTGAFAATATLAAGAVPSGAYLASAATLPSDIATASVTMSTAGCDIGIATSISSAKRTLFSAASRPLSATPPDRSSR